MALKSSSSSIILALFVICLCALFPPNHVCAFRFDQIVNFGDSLSDYGNAYRITNGTWPRPHIYYTGRFSNGPTYIEDMATDLTIPLNSYAYGGSTSSNDNVQGVTGEFANVPVPSLLDQIDLFEADHNAQKLLGGRRRNNRNELLNTLFVTFIGFNDFFLKPDSRPDVVVNNIMTGMRKIYDLGGRNFLLFPFPALQYAPYFVAKKATAQIEQIVNITNALMYTNFQAFGAAKGNALLFMPDAYSLSVDFVQNPSTYGISVTQFPCFDFVNLDKVCPNPEEYIYFDPIHPSSTVHQKLADLAEQTVSVNGIRCRQMQTKGTCNAYPNGCMWDENTLRCNDFCRSKATKAECQSVANSCSWLQSQTRGNGRRSRRTSRRNRSRRSAGVCNYRYVDPSRFVSG